ncbi:hypothetical protein P12x_005368 [Tundrisphaera lichenicola]|uniref:hypothetical protein n=1 Tax=Tundrisphaera lichenicola TaxID=2029860 RepID=UPI003EC021B7
MIGWFKPKTLIATAGAVLLPLGALAYLASVPGPKSTAVVLLQVGIVIGGVVLFGLMLAKFLEQMNAARVGRWLETPEGREWIEALPDEEREAFLARFEDFKDRRFDNFPKS